MGYKVWLKNTCKKYYTSFWILWSQKVSNFTSLWSENSSKKYLKCNKTYVMHREILRLPVLNFQPLWRKHKTTSIQDCITQQYVSFRDRLIFCTDFTIRTTFKLILTHPRTPHFEHSRQINLYTLQPSKGSSLEICHWLLTTPPPQSYQNASM